MLTIYTLGDPVLEKKADPVADINGAIAGLSAEMLDTMYRGRGIGLAAPQVGILSRLFVCHVGSDKPRVFVNPEIAQMAVDTTVFEEGCLSIPGIYADVIRPVWINVHAFDERGKPFSLDADGFLARVIQHEIDHLNGTLFIDRVTEKKRERLVRMFEKRARR